MLAPENRYSRTGRGIRHFDARPYQAAAASLRPQEGPAAGPVLAWGIVLVVVPLSWAMTVVWAVDMLF